MCQIALLPLPDHVTGILEMPDPSEDVGRFIDLANFRLTRWTDRRNHEWAVSVALWVGLVGAALSGKIAIPVSLLASGLFVFVAVHAALWVRFNWTRNQDDLREAFNYLGEAHKALKLDALPPVRESGTQYGCARTARLLSFWLCLLVCSRS
jgi:hypothetical protein